MFKRIVTILKRLMGYQSIAPSVPAETTVSKSVKQPRAKSGQTSLGAQAQPKSRKSSPARTPRKPKQEAAPLTTAARKPGKKKPTARQVAMVSQSKPTGSKSKTPASKTRRHAK